MYCKWGKVLKFPQSTMKKTESENNYLYGPLAPDKKVYVSDLSE